MSKRIFNNAKPNYGNKKVKHGNAAERKEINSLAEPENYLRQHPSWRFMRADKERWIITEDFVEHILPFLASFETMTWQEILSASKGHGSGSKNHEIEVSKLIRDAQKRLEELRIYDDTLTSLRFGGKPRLWGNREANVFNILWYDAEHEICPSNRRLS